MNTVITGQCLCGTVRFAVTPPTLWCAHCHCTMCRRAHGAAFVTWFGCARGNFAISAGADAVRWYRSSPPARRGFCARCGSTLFFESERWPDETHIALANVDGTIDRKPSAHVSYDHRAHWFPFQDDLKKIGGFGDDEPNADMP
ncbi:MAG: GFA family protein [Gammaproteobacteria bacterium]